MKFEHRKRAMFGDG